MNRELFNNKYYNQLFGGKKEEETSETNDASERTEDTRERLERIFGGEPKGRKPNPAKQTIRESKKAQTEEFKSMSDADYARAKGFVNLGNGIFELKNGATARRLPDGRLRFVKGASSEKLDEIRKLRKSSKSYVPSDSSKDERMISKSDASSAFAKYWSRKARDAAKYDRKNKLSNTPKSRALAVSRARNYRMTHSKSPEKTLSVDSPKGYLYLRRDKFAGKGASKRLTRHAGVRTYDFEGVAPREFTKTVKGKEVTVPVVPYATRKYKTSESKAKAQAARSDFSRRARDPTDSAFRARKTTKPSSARPASSRKASSRKASASPSFGTDEL